VGALSARSAQIRRHVDRYEAAWRAAHPDEEPGPRLREAWDRRAWAEARPDKVGPKDGAELVARWNAELRDLGYHGPDGPVVLKGTLPARIDRDAAADLVVSILGARRSAWNAADIRGGVETLLAQVCVVADTAPGPSWPRTSPPAPSSDVCRWWPAPTCPNTSGPSPPPGC